MKNKTYRVKGCGRHGESENFTVVVVPPMAGLTRRWKMKGLTIKTLD